MKFHVDDWGMAKGINDAALFIAERSRLSHVSILSNSPYAEYRLNELLARPEVKINLHLNFCFGSPVSEVQKVSSLVDGAGRFFSYKKFLQKYYLRKIKTSELRLEIKNQLARIFEICPSINAIDGHQHVHLLPGIYPHVEAMALESSVTRLRVVHDSSHWGSMILSVGHSLLRRPKLAAEYCAYARGADWSDKRRLARKRWPILTHPAFLRGDDDGYDEMYDERFNEAASLKAMI